MFRDIDITDKHGILFVQTLQKLEEIVSDKSAIAQLLLFTFKSKLKREATQK